MRRCARSPEFVRRDAPIGRWSIPPEKLLRALRLQALYSVRSERQLTAQMEYNLLFPWFPRVGPKGRPRSSTRVMSQIGPRCRGRSLSSGRQGRSRGNRDGLLDGDNAAKFFCAVLSQPPFEALLSDEHFSADGTLIEAWASMKSFKPNGEGGSSDELPAAGTITRRERGRATGTRPGARLHGEQRTNATDTSTTDPDARLLRQGGEAPPQGPPEAPLHIPAPGNEARNHRIPQPGRPDGSVARQARARPPTGESADP